jgi:diacylglycerol kinase family enzyme
MFWIILNPSAGNGKARKEYFKIKRFLKSSGVKFDIILTKGPGDALEIARNCPLDGDAAVVAAGGDGTCNEVINGLLTNREPPAKPPLFGILPLGRGNDFAYSAGASGGLDQALKLLAGRKISPPVSMARS